MCKLNKQPQHLRDRVLAILENKYTIYNYTFHFRVLPIRSGLVFLMFGFLFWKGKICNFGFFSLESAQFCFFCRNHLSVHKGSLAWNLSILKTNTSQQSQKFQQQAPLVIPLSLLDGASKGGHGPSCSRGATLICIRLPFRFALASASWGKWG